MPIPLQPEPLLAPADRTGGRPDAEVLARVVLVLAGHLAGALLVGAVVAVVDAVADQRHVDAASGPAPETVRAGRRGGDGLRALRGAVAELLGFVRVVAAVVGEVAEPSGVDALLVLAFELLRLAVGAVLCEEAVLVERGAVLNQELSQNKLQSFPKS